MGEKKGSTHNWVQSALLSIILLLLSAVSFMVVSRMDLHTKLWHGTMKGMQGLQDGYQKQQGVIIEWRTETRNLKDRMGRCCDGRVSDAEQRDGGPHGG